MEDGGCRMEEAAIRELKEYAGRAKDTMGQMLPQEPECQRQCHCHRSERKKPASWFK